MGLRLELTVTLLILAIVLAAVMVRLSSVSPQKKSFTKELEFKDTLITEVSTQSLKSMAFSAYGVREAGKLHLYEVAYHSKELQMLRANHAMYSNGTIYLDGNITVTQKKGFIYYGQKARYDKNAKVLEITSDFKGVLKENLIYGTYLHYNLENKEVYAENIDAMVYTTEGQKP